MLFINNFHVEVYNSSRSEILRAIDYWILRQEIKSEANSSFQLHDKILLCLRILLYGVKVRGNGLLFMHISQLEMVRRLLSWFLDMQHYIKIGTVKNL